MKNLRKLHLKYTLTHIRIGKMVYSHSNTNLRCLTLTVLTWTKWRAPASASKWRMGFNSAFKGLNVLLRTSGCLITTNKWRRWGKKIS
jgi:hypothetical protein